MAMHPMLADKAKSGKGPQMGKRLAFCASTAAIALLTGVNAAAAAAASGPASATSDEILVTATKRSTPLQKTPLAVTAVSSATLEKQHVNTIQDVTHLVPNFQATSEGDHGVVTMTLRGVGNDSAKTEYADPEVAMFINGVYSPRAEGAAALLFDLDAVEVLRGPQGTLWGRNSTVGAVNIITARPTFDSVYGSVQAGGGSYAHVGVRGAINIPLGDTLAVRVAFADERHDGYVDYQSPKLPSLASQMVAATAGGIAPGAFQAINPNIFVQGGPKYSAQDQAAIRASVRWAPTPKLSWNISYEYFRDRGTPGANLMQVPRAGEKFWSSLVDTAPYLQRDVHSIRSRLEYDVTEDIGLAYIAGYSHFTGASDYDQDGGVHIPTSFATGATYQEDRTNSSTYQSHSHEVELKSLGEQRLDWILGLYYAAEDNSIRFDIPIFNGTQQGTVAWQGSFIQPKETVESKAVFGQVTLHVSDAVRLTGGLRYTDDVRTNQGGTNNAWSYNSACPQVPLDPGTNPLNPSINPSCFNTYQHNDGRYTANKLTYLAKADVDLARGFLAYASFSTGYKSGGLQDGGFTYGPETVFNYEVGTKNTFLNGRVTFNNAFFYEDIKGYQFSSPVTFPGGNRGLATANASSAKIYGFESEFTARPSSADTIQVTAAFLHTKLGVLEAGSNDYGNLVANFGPGGLIRNGPACSVVGAACATFTGNTLAHSPSFSAQAIWEHDFELMNGGVLAPRVSFHYETSSWLSLFNDGLGDKQGSYTRTDLNLIYRAPGDKRWSVEFYVQNLEDGKIRTNAGATGDNIYTSQYMPPRTFGANVKIDF